jgi:CheY-like chemotaxis protein/putative methionine-R-sulfoxide reductase with GAF domain
VVVRDITSTRLSMRKLDAIDRAGLELVRLDAKTVRELNTYKRLELLEQKIVKLMHEVLEYDHFAIFVIDEPREKLELVIAAGLPQEIHNLDLSPEHEGSGISGYVAATGKSYICRDATADDRFIPGLAGARSSCTVPLRMHDRVIGIMDVESQTASAFKEADRQFLEIFARYIAIALHMLDLLVVERSQTNLSVSGRVGGELEEPLEDIVREIDALGETMIDPTKAGHLKRIREDVDAIRSKLASVAEGPRTLLGVERAMAEAGMDPVLGGKRALVADDEQKIVKVIEAVLTARGCEPVVVHDGQSAIDLLEKAERGEGSFDIVISDIRMPDRNGYEVFSAAQHYAPGMPVILMTGFGYDPHHSIVRASQEGMSCVLFKPFDIEQLIQEMHRALEPAE